MQRFKTLKDISENVHFKHRMKDRLGLRINRQVKRDIISEIEKGKGKLIDKASSNRITLEVKTPPSLLKLNPKFKEPTIFVGWDKMRHRLVTAFIKDTFLTAEQRRKRDEL